MIKKNIYKTLSNFYKGSWGNVSEKVLIEVNNYFTKQNWTESFNEFDIHEKYRIIFTHNKYQSYKYISEADYFFSFSLNKHVLGNANKLKFIYHGLRGDAEDTHYKFKVYNIPPLAKTAIAEYVIGILILMVRRLDIPVLNKSRKRWDQKDIISAGYKSITDLRIGICGYGNIGQEIGKYFHNIGCKNYVMDSKTDNFQYVHKYFPPKEIKSFFSSIDVLIISIPFNEETKKYFSEHNLNYLKENVYLINISRGKLIDEELIIKLIKAGRFTHTALDVFINEPIPKKSKLWNLNNLYLSPHIAGNVNLFVKEIQKDFILKIKEN